MDQTLTETIDFTSPSALEKGMVLLGEKYEPETLQSLEMVIAKGIKSFWETGRALDRIRREQLWSGKYPSFNHYLRLRWDISPARASHLIGAAKVVDLITTVNKTPSPNSERVVRPLVPLLTVPVTDLKGLPEEEAAEVIAERKAEREALIVRIYKAAAKASGSRKPTSKDVGKQVQLLAPEQKSKPQAEPETVKLVVEPRVRERFDKHWAMFWHLLADEDPEVIWDLIAEQEGNAVPTRPVRATTADDASESTGPTRSDTPSLEVAHEIATEVVAPDGVAGPGTVPEPSKAPEAAEPIQDEVQAQPTPVEQMEMELTVTYPSVKPETVPEKPKIVPAAPVRKFEELQASRKIKLRRRNIRVRPAR